MQSMFCALRLTPETSIRQVEQYLNYLFGGLLDEPIRKDVVEIFKEFKSEGLSGRLVYDAHTGELAIKEDIRR